MNHARHERPHYNCVAKLNIPLIEQQLPVNKVAALLHRITAFPNEAPFEISALSVKIGDCFIVEKFNEASMNDGFTWRHLSQNLLLDSGTCVSCVPVIRRWSLTGVYLLGLIAAKGKGALRGVSTDCLDRIWLLSSTQNTVRIIMQLHRHLPNETGSDANPIPQEPTAVDEYESLALENASKTILDMKDSIETIPPCEKFNKQLQFLQLLFKKLLSGQGYSQPDIHPKNVSTNDILETESSAL